MPENIQIHFFGRIADPYCLAMPSGGGSSWFMTPLCHLIMTRATMALCPGPQEKYGAASSRTSSPEVWCLSLSLPWFSNSLLPAASVCSNSLSLSYCVITWSILYDRSFHGGLHRSPMPPVIWTRRARVHALPFSPPFADPGPLQGESRTSPNLTLPFSPLYQMCPRYAPPSLTCDSCDWMPASLNCSA